MVRHAAHAGRSSGRPRCARSAGDKRELCRCRKTDACRKHRFNSRRGRSEASGSGEGRLRTRGRVARARLAFGCPNSRARRYALRRGLPQRRARARPADGVADRWLLHVGTRCARQGKTGRIIEDDAMELGPLYRSQAVLGDGEELPLRCHPSSGRHRVRYPRRTQVSSEQRATASAVQALKRVVGRRGATRSLAMSR
jgi:hypothetical protein